jgi:GH35 family endo-1,4-beta-xylanase
MQIHPLPLSCRIYCQENGAQYHFSINNRKQEEEFIALKMKKEKLTRQQVDNLDTSDRGFIYLDTIGEVDDIDQRLTAAM